MIQIHKRLWYIINPTREDNLAYMTYHENNAAFEKRKSTGTDWAKPYGKWIDGGEGQPRKYIPSELVPEEAIIDNVPVKGIYIGSSVSRWSTSNKLFRVKDPRGFTVEVPTDNIATLLHLTTVVNGVVQEECVWGRDGNNHILLPVNSEPYLETLKKMDIIQNHLIDIKTLKQGDVVTFFGDDMEYTYLGRAKFTWRIKPYTYKHGYGYRYDNREVVYHKEYDHAGSGYVGVFRYKYKHSGNINYRTSSNPKIEKILRNEEIIRENQIDIRPSGNHTGWYNYEVKEIKWKE